MVKIIIGRTGAGKSTRILGDLKALNEHQKKNVLLFAETSEEDKYKKHLKDAKSIHFMQVEDEFPSGEFDTIVVDKSIGIPLIEGKIDLSKVNNIFISAQVKTDVTKFIGTLMENDKGFTVEVLS